MEFILSLVFGVVVGFSLGMTGGGGSSFAVPLLVYGLGMELRDAVGVSLAVVGGTALGGVLLQKKSGSLDLKSGMLFSIGGVFATPFGIVLGKRVDSSLTLALLALLMIYVGYRMWTKQEKVKEADKGWRGIQNRMGFLLITGIGVGVLCGFFGVGGGFVIVPALVLIGGLRIHAAVTTSLLVIFVICLSGVLSHLLTVGMLPLKIMVIFVVGGCLGMVSGIVLKNRISGKRLQQFFAVAMWGVALYVLMRVCLGDDF